MAISDTVVTSWAFYMGASLGPCLYLLKFTDSIWILASIINRKSGGVRYFAIQGLHVAIENFADMNVAFLVVTLFTFKISLPQIISVPLFARLVKTD